ncbi:hypothetical protein [Nocardiopsis oceani]
MYRESVAWFAAEHLFADGQPTDTDRRYDTSADSSADMVTFEPVRDWELVSRIHVRAWLVRLHRREYSSSYVNNQYRCLQQFFKWLADEEEITDPMRKVKPPKVVAEPVPVFEEGEVDRILKMPRTGRTGARPSGVTPAGCATAPSSSSCGIPAYAWPSWPVSSSATFPWTSGGP